MDDRTECEKEYPKDKTEDDKDHNDSETEEEDEYIDGRIEDGKEDRDCEPKDGEDKDIYDRREDELEGPGSEEEVASLYSSALCDETDEEDFLEGYKDVVMCRGSDGSFICLLRCFKHHLLML